MACPSVMEVTLSPLIPEYPMASQNVNQMPDLSIMHTRGTSKWPFHPFLDVDDDFFGNPLDKPCGWRDKPPSNYSRQKHSAAAGCGSVTAQTPSRCWSGPPLTALIRSHQGSQTVFYFADEKQVKARQAATTPPKALSWPEFPANVGNLSTSHHDLI